MAFGLGFEGGDKFRHAEEVDGFPGCVYGTHTDLPVQKDVLYGS